MSSAEIEVDVGLSRMEWEWSSHFIKVKSDQAPVVVKTTPPHPYKGFWW